MGCIVFLYITCVVLSELGGVDCAHSALIFESQTAERSKDALICGLMNYNRTLGVKYDITTQKCTELPGSWFTNRTTQLDNVYYLQTMYEKFFEETMDTGLLEIPGTFQTGSSIAVTFDMRELKDTAFRLYAADLPDFMLLSMGLRYYWNLISYNTYKNRRWGMQEDSELLVKTPNTTYTVEILVAESEFQISLDGVSIYNFTQRYTEAPVYFRFDSKSSYCRHIKYFFNV